MPKNGRMASDGARIIFKAIKYKILSRKTNRLAMKTLIKMKISPQV